MSDNSLLAAVVDTLKRMSLTVFTAESCTGGLISKMITDVSGASEVIKGGIVCYVNEIKTSLLGVKKETIKEYTEVSEQCCYEMAECAKRISGADIGLSTTGYASGGDGVPPDMVGVVYIGISDSFGTSVMRLSLNGDRNEVRTEAAHELLEVLIGRLEAYE